MGSIIVAVYALSLTFLLLYSLGQLHLTLIYLFERRKDRSSSTAQISDGNLPKVTVQLPIYNERFVVERLLQSVVALQYPAHLLEIQVLDDSTDDTSELVKACIDQLSTDFPIHHIQRKKREGYKAGALQHGLAQATGEYIAIFDADFVPNPQFLLETILVFFNPKIGVVQTRWEHLNQSDSWLTQCQAFGLDAHFTVEQSGRCMGNYFMSFNGTAGIWRKSCIIDAGGWQGDTLTEDLDLSYRAQLKGWEFSYLEGIGSPAELPITMSAFKSQQYRWNKGAAETHRKLWRHLRNASLKRGVKLHAMLHLWKGFGFIASLLLALTSVPMLFLRNEPGIHQYVLQALSVTLICVVILALFYYASLLRLVPNRRKRYKYFLTKFPLFVAFSFGTTLHNALAVIEGYIGRKTPFVRTPKLLNAHLSTTPLRKSYRLKHMPLLVWLEIGFILYFTFGIFQAFQLGDWSFVPLHSFILLGYIYVVWQTFKEQRLFTKRT